jgi:hypothetical protein
MKVLLIEPDYYTKYPPLGLIKLASYHRSRGNEVKLVRGVNNDPNFNPDIIDITSLFTYAWQPVHRAIEFYHKLFPNARVEVGGIYASIMSDRIKSFFPYSEVHVGLHEASELYLPAYDLLEDIKRWENWDSSIIFTSRGCIRNCPFCVVPRLEGKIKSVAPDVQNYIYPGHKKVILWDNNFLSSPDWKKAIKNLGEIGLKIDFNQGLDARLIDDEKARLLADLKMPIFRLAYDYISEKSALINAVNLLAEYGVRKRNILVYTLYNFYDPNQPNNDRPESFLVKIRDILDLGCVAYPMRFEPITSLRKNQYISPLWTSEQLEVIADARRVIGYGGAFPPYEGLVKKLRKAKEFTDAFGLYPTRSAINIHCESI